MKNLAELGIEAQSHPDVVRLATAYPYTKAEISGAYLACRGDIEAVECLVRLSLRPIPSDLIASIIDTLRLK